MHQNCCKVKPARTKIATKLSPRVPNVDRSLTICGPSVPHSSTTDAPPLFICFTQNGFPLYTIGLLTSQNKLLLVHTNQEAIRRLTSSCLKLFFQKWKKQNFIDVCASEAIRPLWKAIEWVSPPPLCPLSAVCTLLQNSTILTTFLFLLRPLTELIRLLPCCKWFFYWNVVSPALFFQPNFVAMHIFKPFCWGAQGSDGSAAGETPLPWWIATGRLCLPIHILSHQDHVQTSEPLRMSYTDNQSGKRAYFVLGPFCVGADKAPAVPHAVPGGATHFPFTSLCCPQPSPQAPTLLSAAPTSTHYKCTLLSPVQMCT